MQLKLPYLPSKSVSHMQPFYSRESHFADSETVNFNHICVPVQLYSNDKEVVDIIDTLTGIAQRRVVD